MKNIGVVFNNKNNMDLFGIDVVHVVLLTHVDTLDLITKADLIYIYKYVPVQLKVMGNAICKHIFSGIMSL